MRTAVRLRRHPEDVRGRNPYKIWIRRSERGWKELRQEQERQYSHILRIMLEWWKEQERDETKGARRR